MRMTFTMCSEILTVSDCFSKLGYNSNDYGLGITSDSFLLYENDLVKITYVRLSEAN